MLFPAPRRKSPQRRGGILPPTYLAGKAALSPSEVLWQVPNAAPDFARSALQVRRVPAPLSSHADYNFGHRSATCFRAENGAWTEKAKGNRRGRVGDPPTVIPAKSVKNEDRPDDRPLAASPPVVTPDGRMAVTHLLDTSALLGALPRGAGAERVQQLFQDDPAMAATNDR